MASIVFSSNFASTTLAPATTSESGPPWRSAKMLLFDLVPFFHVILA
jgi:hypothetical protein